MSKIYKYLFSTRLMGVLMLVYAAAMGVATFIENDYGTPTAKVLVYNAWWFELIMLLLCLNFIGNIKRYRLFRKEKWSVLVLHLSFIFILVGAGITRYISYEGVMPILEGETTNEFYSETTYFDFIVDDREVQKTPVSKPLMLTALGDNDFEIDTDFKGTPIHLELIDYIPNAKRTFVEEEGDEVYLHFVESSSGNRHDHYIKRGELENVHGVLVGFHANDNQTNLNFIETDSGLQLKSGQAGTFFRMADQFQGEIVAGEYQDFNLLSVHNIGEVQFVVPTPPIKGKMIYERGDRDSYPLDLLKFNLRAGDQETNFELMGGQYNTEPATEIQLGKYNFRINYGSKLLTLPFYLKLRDFQLDRYPGSQSAMSYASEVTVIDPDETFDFRIFMNNILNYRGYKFFQSSYDLSGPVEETRLSVNHDFWGTTITYIGYILLYAGLMLIMVLKGTRFDELRNKLVKIQKKKAQLSILAFIILSSFSGLSAQNHEHSPTNPIKIDSLLQADAVSQEHAAKFARLIIQDGGGRMKPINTFSSEMLRKVSKKDTYQGLNSDQVFLSIMENPRVWFDVDIIYLERGNDQIRTILGIPTEQKHAALSDFLDPMGNYKIREMVEKAQQKNIRSKFEKDLINIDQRVGLLYSAIGGGILRIFPVPNDDNNTWVSYAEIGEAGFSGKDSIFVRNALPIYIQSLKLARNSNSYSSVDQLLGSIKSYQEIKGADVYPKPEKTDLEIAYNKYDVFKKLFSYYMYAGTLMLIFVLIQIFSKRKWVDWVVKGFIAIIIAMFFMHTAGLIARWYISGHAPWSNAYESMIYVAWATMCFGLVFGKKSSLTIAATAFLTSMILMIAHWNWMDPEIANLQPVLNSYWLMIHVAIIVASYGPFALSMIIGFLALFLIIFSNKKNKNRIKLHLDELTLINEMSMTLGLVLLTIGNFLGGMWANESWGRYWGWDPKETWALISIFVYAFVLHIRLIPGLKGKYTFNLWSIIAFASILMTYFGVNFYLSGLHAYASGDKVVTPTFVYVSILFVALVGAIAKWKWNKIYKK